MTGDDRLLEASAINFGEHRGEPSRGFSVRAKRGACRRGFHKIVADDSSRKAFTLIELIVVMGIFTILVGAFSDVYLRTSRQGQQIAARTKLQSDARFAMEAIAREIRAYNIDYAAYAAPAGPLPAMPITDLKLRNPFGSPTDTVEVKLDALAADCPDANSTPCITVSVGGGPTAPLTPRGTRVEYLKFYADPPHNPFYLDTATGTYATDPGENRQPRVTVVFGLRGLTPRIEDQWVYRVQTTVTPRIYLR